MKELGFSIVELLSACPTNWRMMPVEAMDWIRDHMIPFYLLGDYKVVEELKKKSRRVRK